MKKLTISSAQLVASARSQIKELPSSQAIDLHNDDNVVIVDLRDIRERKRDGFIPNSVHAPRGMIEFWVDPDSPYFKEIFGQSKRFILHCASGWRSALTVATLQEMGFDAEFVTRVRGMIRGSQFKRRLPVIAKISERTIDTDFRYSRDWGS